MGHQAVNLVVRNAESAEVRNESGTPKGDIYEETELDSSLLHSRRRRCGCHCTSRIMHVTREKSI